MRRILCYGDSNTYGFDPDTGLRHDESHRWTAILGKLLGNEWHVVEEGLSGRNTGLQDPVNPIRDGKAFLPVALSSQRPLDVVILMLGSNDFKTCFHQNAEMVSSRVVSLAKEIESYPYGPFPAPKCVVVAPMPMDRQALLTGKFDEESLVQSARFPQVLGSFCETSHLSFFDASKVCKVGKDGQHLDSSEHKKLAQALASFLA